ncbi:serine hydrolase [Altererythrobacter sp. CC-YST694]|uniref:serine hydrolase n=1 Tax=Altererythrobacter sp. CC-YST694 TaxID=2755038 RepID=UPI001D008472|nr:serine hydrolase [Altererythrobacter sp. CC-YST694]MCB5424471.1 serine hydrolase [Altererythrobacter sp. CC-YST694]
MKNLLIAGALLIAFPSAAFAQEDSHALEDASRSRAEDIRAVMAGNMAPERVFSPSFLAAVPAAQIKAIADQLISANGPIRAVDQLSYQAKGAATFNLVFEKTKAAATLQLDSQPPYLVTGFRIGAVAPIDDTPTKITEEIAALPGKTQMGVYILDGDETRPLLTSKPSEQMAIGSTFKLYVLSALAGEIKAGKRHWSDVVRLDAPSIPSGQMQNWPIGAPVTLQTLATMMISISDNTATDVLMRTLGRDVVEAELIAAGHAEPSDTLPLLTTVEFFALKTDPAKVAAYKAADDAGQRALLAQWAPSLTADKVEVARFIGSGPAAIDSIEWFASAEDLARIYRRLRDMDDPTVMAILGINTALPPAEKEKWDYVGYKGGSETGVIDLSWLLKDRQGRWIVVTMAWNNPDRAVDDSAFLALGHRLIGTLHQ